MLPLRGKIAECAHIHHTILPVGARKKRFGGGVARRTRSAHARPLSDVREETTDESGPCAWRKTSFDDDGVIVRRERERLTAVKHPDGPHG